MWYAGRYVQMRDVEIINGAVTGKAQERVSCSHSYSCNCTRNSKGNRTCSTCYEHLFDYDWVLFTSANTDKIKITRVNRQGTEEPPRFTKAKIGDPVAAEHSYLNYVKAARNSLFYDKGEVITDIAIPAYPGEIFDYHYVNRVLSINVPVQEVDKWNHEIGMALRELGPKKEANFIVAFVNGNNPTYAQALERAWIGGKKNDVVLVLGTPKYPEISWVRVLSWTDKQDFKVKLRDDVLALKTVDRERIIQALVENTDKLFLRKQMSDFEYLKYEIDPPLWVTILTFLTSAAASIFMSIYFSKNKVTFASFFGAILAVIVAIISIPFRFRR